jgi:glyoxylase-like metal-dependent hydrolase (beta-lactamase superfamily II)
VALVIEQWRSGREFAARDTFAAQMVNFTYLIGDDSVMRAWLVDPAWDVRGILDLVRHRRYELAGVLLSHWHPDHAGGEFFGITAEGAAEVRKTTGCAIHAHRAEAPWLAEWAKIPESELTLFDADEELTLGKGVGARCVHSPGHTPGSTCYLVTDGSGKPGALFTGDVLFVGACGRVDLPGSDPLEMKRTLLERLAALPPETIAYPGHDYGPRPTSTLAEERRSNPYLIKANWQET